MIATIIFLAFVLLVALVKAEVDKRTIDKGIDVNHAVGLFYACVAIGMIGGTIIDIHRELLEWRTLLWMPMAWGLFTMSFRFLLNRKRGLDWRYISPSSDYDWMWMRITGAVVRPHNRWSWKNYRAMVSGSFWINYEEDDGECARAVHRVGTIAYIIEATVFAAATFAYAW